VGQGRGDRRKGRGQLRHGDKTDRKPGCFEMLEILKATKKKLPGLKPRESYITFRGVNALRKAAHELGHPGAALAYALQFEADQRQLDTIGQWVKLNEPTR
jgi:hypothetical protein